jgi:hypothetical protein
MKMIQIPEGKSLKAVKDNGTVGQPCKGCFFEDEMVKANYEKKKCICHCLACSDIEHSDGMERKLFLLLNNRSEKAGWQPAETDASRLAKANTICC